MSHIFDAVIAVVVMILMMAFGTSIIEAQVNTSSARSYKNDIVTELENSSYNANVINKCMTQAEDNGYRVSITLYSQGKPAKTFTTATVEVTDSVDTVAAEVLLTYQYKLTYLGTKKTHCIRGFAR